MNKLKSTRIYGDLYIDGLAKVNSNDIITTTNLSSTIQTVSPNSLTTTGNRSYSIQRNASGQLVVNIPWTDTNTNWYPTSFSWTNGTTNGPVGSLTGTGMPNVSIGAIPAASNTESGIVTIGAQTFKGNKTFTDNVTLSGDLTVLGAMNVKNVNVLETSSGIIFEGGSGSGKVTMELATDPGTTSYSLKVPNKNGIIATDDIMTNTTPGLGKLFDNTVQSVAANTISKTASRTYGIQRNSNNQLVVNVPWEDNNAIYSAGNGLTLSGNAFSLPVSTSGTGTFVTGITQLTNGIQVNLGTPPNTNTHWTSKNVIGGSSTASTDGTSINGNTYINHIESGLSSPTSSHNIVGTGATTVTSDANGKITINSVDTKTNNYLTGVSGSGNGTVTFTRQGLSNLTWDASHTHDGDYTAVVNLTVATAAATAAKTTTETVTFQEGVIYFIRFTLGNSVSTVTLNGINMRLGTTNVSTTTMTLGANAVIPVYFDATANRLQITGSYRTSDATEAYTVRWNAAVKAGVQITRYKLLVQGEDNKYYPTTIGNTDGNTKTVSTVPFLIGTPILFYNTTTTVATNANTSTTTNYTGILTSNTARTWNQNSGWRAQEDVYLKGTISGSFFTLDNTTTTSHMTQDLPTTDDGFYYLRLGMMTNTTTGFKLSVEHPIYYFANGELQLLAQQANAVKTYQKADNVNYNIPFVLDLTDDEFKRLYTDNSAHLTYNPSTNALGVSGTITSSGQAVVLNNDSRLTNSRPASDVSAWAKKSSLAIGDIPTGTTGSTVALGNHTHTIAQITNLQTTLSNFVDLTSDQVINGKKTFTDLVVGVDSEESDLWTIDTPSNTYLNFLNSNDISVMTLRNDGRVGIGKDPAIGFALDVSGQAQISGNTYLQGAGLFVNDNMNIRPMSLNANPHLSIFDNVTSDSDITLGNGSVTVNIPGTLNANTFNRSYKGLVPNPGGSTTTRYLREDGTWVVPPNSNTTYTAGSGLTLSGTTFSLPVTTSGSGTFVSSVVQNTNGITVTMGTPPNTTYTAGSNIQISGSNVISATNTNTLNTAGATDTSEMIFLVGATSQAANPQTYSDNEVYVKSGVLTTKEVQVGGTAATMKYDSTSKSIKFVFV